MRVPRGWVASPSKLLMYTNEDKETNHTYNSKENNDKSNAEYEYNEIHLIWTDKIEIWIIFNEWMNSSCKVQCKSVVFWHHNKRCNSFVHKIASKACACFFYCNSLYTKDLFGFNACRKDHCSFLSNWRCQASVRWLVSQSDRITQSTWGEEWKTAWAR